MTTTQTRVWTRRRLRIAEDGRRFDAPRVRTGVGWWQAGYSPLMPINLTGAGIDRLVRGLRRGDQRLIYSGAALLAMALWRRSRQREPRLVYRRELKPGKAVTVHLGQAGKSPLHVERADP